MTHMKIFNLKRPDLARFARLNGFDLSFVLRVIAQQFAFDQSASERGGINWRRNIRNNVLDRANMIFVPMRNDDGLNLTGTFF